MLRLLILLLLLPLFQDAEARIASAVPKVDFGRIKEEDGPVKRRFYIYNVDTVPQALLKIAPSCGCTAVDFQKESFAPGDSVWVDIIYDPELRPGKFEKYVRVYPVEGPMIRVPIEGVVEATASTVDYHYPIDAGLLHLTEKTLFSSRPLLERQRSFFVDVYNTAEIPVWMEIENANEAIETEIYPNPVPPKESATISFFVDPDNEKRRDVSQYTVNLYNSDTPEEIKKSTPVEIKIITDNHGTP